MSLILGQSGLFPHHLLATVSFNVFITVTACKTPLQ